MQKYEDWKNWQSDSFAKASVEEYFYFSKLINFFKLSGKLNVLEIGFGNGSFLDFSKTRGWNIYGVEEIPALIQRARKSGYIVFDDIDEIPHQIKFDLVAAFDVMEHIKSEEIIVFLEKIKSYLAEDGSLIIRVPNGSSPLGLANQYGDFTHVSVITPNKMDYWASCSNLDIDYQGGDIFPIYNGRLIKLPIRLIKRIFQIFIERLLRWIFSPQPKGFLSANSLFLLRLRK